MCPLQACVSECPEIQFLGDCRLVMRLFVLKSMGLVSAEVAAGVSCECGGRPQLEGVGSEQQGQREISMRRMCRK